MKTYPDILTASPRRLALICLLGCSLAGGCRSTRPSWNLFGFRSEPSAETLAGSGPTTTYPVPPSSKATPEAIASVAGGTAAASATSQPQTPPYAGTQFAGLNPNSSPSASQTTSSPAMPGTNAAPTATSPYALAGSRQQTPAMTAGTPPAYALPGQTASPTGAAPNASATAPSQYAAAAANGYQPNGYQLPGATAATPAITTPTTTTTAPSRIAATQPQATSTTPAATESKPASGFSLPSGLALPSGGSQTATAEIAQSAPTTDNSASAFTPPADLTADAGATTSSTPVAQTASAAAANMSSSPSPSVQPVGYTPGSTGQSSSYPIKR